MIRIVCCGSILIVITILIFIPGQQLTMAAQWSARLLITTALLRYILLVLLGPVSTMQTAKVLAVTLVTIIASWIMY